MPLPEPVPREAVHRREVVCRGYRREDGLWDIEGHLTDTKDYDFRSRFRGEVPAGDPVHDMWIRLTVDEDLVVREVHVAVHRSPYPLCPAVIPNFQRLKGLPIARGWRHGVRERLGGVHGCTHLVEMLAPLATAAFQTIFPLKGDTRRVTGEEKEREGERRPMLLNSCHAYAETSPVVRELYPAHYRAPAPDESLYDEPA